MSRVARLSCVMLLQVVPQSRSEAQESPSFDAPVDVLLGDSPTIVFRDLAPNASVRIHALRVVGKWEETDGAWSQRPIQLHAWGEFTADEDGTVIVDSATPRAGTFRSGGGLGLLRSGLPVGDPRIGDVFTFAAEDFNGLTAQDVALALEYEDRIVQRARLHLIYGPPDLLLQEVTLEGGTGVFAKPQAELKPTVVIFLHGSEGGSPERAKRNAQLLASRGFPTLAINYFAWPDEPIEGVPTEHSNIRIEILEGAKDWLDAQPELHYTHIAVYGVSKGAEFALVGATHYDWIDAVIAVVPSDVVWEGYSEGWNGGLGASSWSLDGRPLPYIPVFPRDDKLGSLYRTNAERYARSRAYHADLVEQARIPIEDTNARLLLLASDRDEIWPSGEMTRNLAERLMAAGKGDLLTVRIFPTAGHSISGTGTFPVWLYGEQNNEPGAIDILAGGDAAADAWQQILAFLRDLPDE